MDIKLVSFLLSVVCMIVVHADECFICPTGEVMMSNGATLSAGMFTFYPNETTCFSFELMMETGRFNATDCAEVQTTDAAELCNCAVSGSGGNDTESSPDVAMVVSQVQIQLLSVATIMSDEVITSYNAILTEYYNDLLSGDNITGVTSVLQVQSLVVVNSTIMPLNTLVNVSGIMPSGSDLDSAALESQLVGITKNNTGALLSLLNSTESNVTKTYFKNVTKVAIFNSSSYPAPAPAPTPKAAPTSTIIDGPSTGATVGIMAGIFVGLALLTYLAAHFQMKKQEERLAARAVRVSAQKLPETAENNDDEDGDIHA